MKTFRIPQVGVYTIILLIFGVKNFIMSELDGFDSSDPVSV